MNEQVFAVLPEQEGKRIDAFVCEQLDGITRSMVQNWIEQGHVTLASGKAVKKNYKVSAGDEVIVQSRSLWRLSRKTSRLTLFMKMKTSLLSIKHAAWWFIRLWEIGTVRSSMH